MPDYSRSPSVSPVRTRLSLSPKARAPPPPSSLTRVRFRLDTDDADERPPRACGRRRPPSPPIDAANIVNPATTSNRLSLQKKPLDASPPLQQQPIADRREPVRRPRGQWARTFERTIVSRLKPLIQIRGIRVDEKEIQRHDAALKVAASSEQTPKTATSTAPPTSTKDENDNASTQKTPMDANSLVACRELSSTPSVMIKKRRAPEPPPSSAFAKAVLSLPIDGERGSNVSTAAPLPRSARCEGNEQQTNATCFASPPTSSSEATATDVAPTYDRLPLVLTPEEAAKRPLTSATTAAFIQDASPTAISDGAEQGVCYVAGRRIAYRLERLSEERLLVHFEARNMNEEMGAATSADAQLIADLLDETVVSSDTQSGDSATLSDALPALSAPSLPARGVTGKDEKRAIFLRCL